MIKYQITKAEYEALDEPIKALYVEKGEDAYRLDVDAGEEDNLVGIKQKRDELHDQLKAQKRRAEELEAREREQREEAERKERERQEREGDYKSMQESTKAELEKSKQRIADMEAKEQARTINGEADRLSQEIATDQNAASILSTFVRQRLKLIDGKLTVTDQNGNATVSSVDELKAEFANSDRFASLVKGRQATGGGAAGTTKTGAAQKKFSDMGDKEREEIFRTDPERFNREVQALKGK